MRFVLMVASLCCAYAVLPQTSLANDKGIDIKIDVNDHKAERSPIRSFSGNNMTFGEMRKKLGRLADHQIVGIWCEGPTMGTSGLSAFDILYGNKIADGIRKYRPQSSTALVDICIADDFDFKAKRKK